MRPRRTQSIQRQKSTDNKEQILFEAIADLLRGSRTRGEILRDLRKNVLKMNQQDFCKLSRISRRSLTDLENDYGGLNEETVNKAFEIFGLKLGLVPCSDSHVEKLLAGQLK
ncbi:helix-turn-helix domain-containing protein [Alteromonas oceanisediminis]|uniref:helix-turn-helix domain-containing protein n=1 Tax=Alteromonas oceanisediminis TaxID=2836180 RepID=UPI001BDAAA68|nr:helix-turn-helix domain-containing protein [Alteromonas oceanisediminis]